MVAFVARQPLESLFVSEVTFAEIRFGIERVSDIAKGADLQDWLAGKFGRCSSGGRFRSPKR